MSPVRRTLRTFVAPAAVCLSVMSVAALAYAAVKPSTTGLVSAASSTSGAIVPRASSPVTTSAARTSAPAAKPSSTPKPPPSGYLGRLGAATGAGTVVAATVTPSAAPAGTLVAVTVLLVGSSSGTPQITDAVGNTYRLAVNQSDASGNAALIYTATLGQSITPGDVITVTFPASSAYAIAVDGYQGRKAVDQTASAAGSGTSGSSGSTATTTASNEIAVAAFADTAGTATLTGFTALPPITAGAATLATGYRAMTATGTASAAGTAPGGNWLAGLATLR